MPIEIHILSGSRQGEQLWFDADEVGVGEGAECQVRFSGDLPPAARGRKAALRMSADGWQGISTEWWHFDCGDRLLVRQNYMRIL